MAVGGGCVEKGEKRGTKVGLREKRMPRSVVVRKKNINNWLEKI